MNHTTQRIQYLIIGQGLAGSILAYHLLQQGKSVLVINKTNQNSSSHVAAGLFCPVAGQRLAITCDNNAYTYMQTFYQKLERELHASFFHPMAYTKVLSTPKLKLYSQKKLNNPACNSYLTSTNYDSPHESLPALNISASGYLDTHIFLSTLRTYLEEKQAYREQWFDISQLKVTTDNITYKGTQAERLIFCNGIQAADNPFFNDLPFNPTKGEILTVRMDWPLERIISSTVFILPLGNNLFHVGATFERDFLSTDPTPEGKQWLIQGLEQLTDKPYEIVAHTAGIRPTTYGHKPFIGWHKEHGHVGVFSGFGSKGVTTIPYLAHKLSVGTDIFVSK